MDNHIAVIGAGRMGISIIDFLLSKGFKVIAITRTPEQAENLNGKWKKTVSRQLKYGAVTEDQAADLENRYFASSKMESISHAGIIIETVNEDIEVKRKVYSAINENMGKDAFVASNSSSISPQELADGVFDVSRVVGLHFFFPVPVSNIVEFITHPFVDENVYRRATEFIKRCGLFAVEQTPENAFILNMLSMAVGGEAFRGAAKFGIHKANELSQSEIFPLGAFSLFDHVQIPVILEATKRYFNRDPLRNKESYQGLLEFMKLMVPEDGSQSLTFSEIGHPGDLPAWQADMPALDDDEAEFSKRLFYLHINSCLFAVEHGLIDESALDESIKAIMGAAKGPIQLAKEIGYGNLREALGKYHAENGAQYYRPSSLLI